MKSRSLRTIRSIFSPAALLLGLLVAMPIGAWSQTFRGGINGTVTDQSGAVVVGAAVEAVDTGTNVSHKTISSSAGTYSFQELPLGTYTVSIAAPGFQDAKINSVPVTAGVIYTLPVKLSVASAGVQTVEVSADAYTLDTTTTTQTTIIDSKSVADSPLNGRDFTQLVTLTPGFSDSGAGGYGSLNGTRANQINWQIDGVDNNDIWHNIPAVNQGGVSGIAGIVLPIDAVDQFSAQTLASAETGRNPGGTVTLGLKSGTNQLHGTAYYFNRNEALGAKSPFSDTKQKVRNYNWGFSAGTPIVKDKLFGFLTFEKQRFVIGLSGLNTEPSAAWQALATKVIADSEAEVSPVSVALINLLYPADTLTGGATTNNYHSSIPEFGYSYNGVAKIDYTINQSNSVSFHLFAGQGNQVAPVGGGALAPYYEVAPIHVQNYQLTFNHTFTPTLTNQINAGVNYFNQIFNDTTTGFDTASTGFITGSPYSNAPNLQISGFDQTGRTPPEGRNDITGQISDNLSWVKGKHQLKMGGEFRKIQLNEFYHRKAQGVYKFKGTEGNWDLSSLGENPSSDVVSRVKSLADFLSGQVNQGSITVGDPERLVYVKTFALFAQDSFQLTPKFNVNYGVRWDYEGPMTDDKKDLSVWRPALGGVVYQGDKIDSLYDPKYTNFSPRIGFSYQALKNTVVRAGVGLYYDTPNLNPFLDNRPGNAAPNGVEGNPVGSKGVKTLTVNSYKIISGVNQVQGDCTVDTPCGIFSIAKNFRPSSNLNYNLQLEQSLTSKVIAQLGFVGTQGRHQLSIVDLNQAPLQSQADQEADDSALRLQKSRPFYKTGNPVFQTYGNINEIQSIGNSNYASLQATLRASNIHRFSGQVAYTWSHSFDDVTAYRGALPQDSNNFKGDYGQSDFDSRNILVGDVSYEAPGARILPVLTKGWQANAKFSLHSGNPFSVLTDDQTDGTQEFTQRANQVGDPYKGAKQAKPNGQWLNADAFANPAFGTYGTSRRNAYIGPGYSDVDLSVFKNTPITEQIKTQLRLEMFNVFNRANYAMPVGGNGSYFFNPNNSTISSLQIYDTIGDFNGAPGIGAGEAFNMQVAFKIIW